MTSSNYVCALKYDGKSVSRFNFIVQIISVESRVVIMQEVRKVGM